MHRTDLKYLILAGSVPYVGDIALTLIGQASSYWSGEHGTINEVNPVGHWVLSIHPAVFVAGAFLYGATISGLIYFLLRIFAWWVSISFLLAHTGGIKSWIPHFASWDSYTIWEGLLNGTTAALATWCYLKSAQVAKMLDTNT